ncbi:MAG TPA: glycosyltransferase [Solirubrobacteraceae bacterium]
MRVLVVSTDYPPHRCGGYELQCAGAVAHLRAHGHEVRVLTSARAGGAPDPLATGVHRDLVRFPVTGDAPDRHAGERVNAAALRAHLESFAPDVVSWWRLGELSMSMPARAAQAGVPGVGMVCDPWFLDGPRRDPMGTEPDRTAARWLFASHALRDQVGGEGDVVAPGIELARFPLAPRADWDWRLLYAGRLSPLKGVDVAIRALAQLPPDATLDIVGDGDPTYVASLHALARELSLTARVRFAGAAAPDGMARAYAAADAVLFPVTWAEPFGLVPLEAMAVGRPVVATGTGGSASYLRDGANALLAAPGDASALAAAVARLAARRELRDRLRAGGRATAERHPAERSHAAVRQALESAAAPRIATRRSAWRSKVSSSRPAHAAAPR